MKKYKLRFKKSVTKDFKRFPKKDVRKILNRIESLVDNPRAEGCIKLSGNENYRVRQGLYRIIYQIKDDILVVTVIKISHRSSVYKNI